MTVPVGMELNWFGNGNGRCGGWVVGLEWNGGGWVERDRHDMTLQIYKHKYDLAIANSITLVPLIRSLARRDDAN